MLVYSVHTSPCACACVWYLSLTSLYTVVILASKSTESPMLLTVSRCDRVSSSYTSLSSWSELHSTFDYQFLSVCSVIGYGGFWGIQQIKRGETQRDRCLVNETYSLLALETEVQGPSTVQLLPRLILLWLCTDWQLPASPPFWFLLCLHLVFLPSLSLSFLLHYSFYEDTSHIGWGGVSLLMYIIWIIIAAWIQFQGKVTFWNP